MQPAEPPPEPYGKNDSEYPLARGLFWFRYWTGTIVLIVVDLMLWGLSIQDHGLVPRAIGVLVVALALIFLAKIIVRRRWA